MCWHTHVIPAFKRLREEDCKFVASLSYIVSESVSKKKKKEKLGAGYGGSHCNSIYSGGWRSETILGKELARSHLKQ
jgi:hypothetical protein